MRRQGDVDGEKAGWDVGEGVECGVGTKKTFKGCTMGSDDGWRQILPIIPTVTYLFVT